MLAIAGAGAVLEVAAEVVPAGDVDRERDEQREHRQGDGHENHHRPPLSSRIDASPSHQGTHQEHPVWFPFWFPLA
jgi:hypothetical protein